MPIGPRPIGRKLIICERCENDDCSNQGFWNPWSGNNPAECSSFRGDKEQEEQTEEGMLEKIRKQMSSYSGGIVIW